MSRFEADIKDMTKLYEWHRKAPKKFQGAAGMMLNNFAFGVRTHALDFWHRQQTVRNKSFVSSRLKFQKTRLNRPINQMESSAFSVDAPRFSGWEEQETGKKTKRTRVATTKARGGNVRRSVRKKMRLRGTSKLMSPRDLGRKSAHIKSPHHAAIVMLAWSRRNIEEGDPFIIYGHNKIKPGIFTWYGDGLSRLWWLSHKNVQPEVNKWMTKSRENYYRSVNLERMWSRVIDKQLAYK